jgi:hypothetical protein
MHTIHTTIDQVYEIEEVPNGPLKRKVYASWYNQNGKPAGAYFLFYGDKISFLKDLKKQDKCRITFEICGTQSTWFKGHFVERTVNAITTDKEYNEQD